MGFSRNLTLLGLVTVMALAACESGPDGPVTLAAGEDPPEYLYEWGILSIRDNSLAIHDEAVIYDLNTPLFSDYAQKLRTVWIPENGSARYHPDRAFSFPVGTVVTKTFYYPLAGENEPGLVEAQAPVEPDSLSRRLSLDRNKLIETRILVRRDDGWQALVYIWNEDQTSARRTIVGAIIPMTMVDSTSSKRSYRFNYLVPTSNQCAGCHVTDNATKRIMPIGLAARHLNKPAPSGRNGSPQLIKWSDQGVIGGLPNQQPIPRNADWTDQSLPVDARARAYLDINCAHCHSRTGPADTSGLFLTADESNLRHLGKCKPPIAAGRGTGGHRFSIEPGAPDQSILVFRMQSTDPGIMMPELGRSLVHREGVELIAEWITKLGGVC